MVTILAAVVGGAYGLFDRTLENTRFQQMRNAQKTIQIAVDQYYAKHNRYPSSLEALTRRYLTKIPDDPTTSFEGNDWLVRGPRGDPGNVAAWKPSTTPPPDGIAEVRSSADF